MSKEESEKISEEIAQFKKEVNDIIDEIPDRMIESLKKAVDKHDWSYGSTPEPACAAGETPRTDAVLDIVNDGGRFFQTSVPAEFARDLERDNAALRAALVGIKHKAAAIQSIRYGPDGDCGADRLANLIEEDAERVLAGKAVAE